MSFGKKAFLGVTLGITIVFLIIAVYAFIVGKNNAGLSLCFSSLSILFNGLNLVSEKG